MYFPLTYRASVLDPRIGYAGLIADCEGDTTSLRELEQAKDKLEEHFRLNYSSSMPPSRSSTPPPSSPGPLSSVFDSPEKFDFTARYDTLPAESIDEWEEFLTLKRESFATCNPIRCWGGRSSRFPKLSKLARDILSMPGLFRVNFWNSS